MKLTPEEYARGVLFWDPPVDGVSFLTATSDSPGDQDAPLMGPLTNPSGSKVLSAPHQFTKLALRADDPTKVESIDRVRWERENVTQVWTGGLGAPPTKLLFVPELGIFHRRVIAVPFIDWEHDAILRIGDTLVRFVTGRVRGEEVTPFDRVSAEGSKWVLEGGSVGSATAEGRFIEVVARGEDERAARLRTQSIFGLIALAMGDHAVGDAIFVEDYEASHDRQQGTVYVPVKTLVPRAAGRDEIDAVHDVLPSILEETKASRARALSLRWYEKGVRSETPADKLFAYFIGIEAIVNYWASSNAPIPVVQERLTRFDAAKALASTLGEEVAQTVRQRMVDSTLTERFQFYIDSHNLNPALLDDLRDSARLRNAAVHGDLATIDEVAASKCRKVLTTILRCELDIEKEFEWEQQGAVFGASLVYTLDASGVMQYITPQSPAS